MIIGWIFLFLTAGMGYLIYQILWDYFDSVRLGVAGGEGVLVILMIIILVLMGLLTGIGALAIFSADVIIIT